MSIRLMSEVFEKSKTEGNARLVLLSIADCCNDEGTCYPSIRKIASKSNVSEAVARKYVNALISCGVLSKDEQGDSISGRQTSNLYAIHEEKIGLDIITKEMMFYSTSPSRLKSRRDITQVRGGGGNPGDRGEGVTPVTLPYMNHHKEPSSEASASAMLNEDGAEYKVDQPSSLPTESEKSDNSQGKAADAANTNPPPDCDPPPPIDELEKNRRLVNRMFSRGDKTKWSDKELKALPNTLGTTEEEWVALLEYYKHLDDDGYFCRQTPLACMNNWAGEIDKAKRGKPKVYPKGGESSAPAPKNTLSGSKLAGREKEFWAWLHAWRPFEEKRDLRAIPPEWEYDFLRGVVHPPHEPAEEVKLPRVEDDLF